MRGWVIKGFRKFVGLDIHKEKIAVSVAEANGCKVRYLGETANTPEAIDKLVGQRRAGGVNLSLARRRVPADMAFISNRRILVGIAKWLIISWQTTPTKSLVNDNLVAVYEMRTQPVDATLYLKM